MKRSYSLYILLLVYGFPIITMEPTQENNDSVMYEAVKSDNAEYAETEEKPTVRDSWNKVIRFKWNYLTRDDAWNIGKSMTLAGVVSGASYYVYSYYTRPFNFVDPLNNQPPQDPHGDMPTRKYNNRSRHNPEQDASSQDLLRSNINRQKEELRQREQDLQHRERALQQQIHREQQRQAEEERNKQQQEVERKKEEAWQKLLDSSRRQMQERCNQEELQKQIQIEKYRLAQAEQRRLELVRREEEQRRREFDGQERTRREQERQRIEQLNRREQELERQGQRAGELQAQVQRQAEELARREQRERELRQVYGLVLQRGIELDRQVDRQEQREQERQAEIQRQAEELARREQRERELQTRLLQQAIELDRLEQREREWQAEIQRRTQSFIDRNHVSSSSEDNSDASTSTELGSSSSDSELYTSVSESDTSTSSEENLPNDNIQPQSMVNNTSISHDNTQSKSIVDNTSTIDCTICLDTKNLSECHIIAGCKHTVCKECLLQSVTNSLDEQNIGTLTCPFKGCTQSFDESDIYALTIAGGKSREDYDRFADMSTYESIKNNDNNMKRCPIQTCGCVHVIETNGIQRRDICFLCHHACCTNCGYDHPGITCQADASIERQCAECGLRHARIMTCEAATKEHQQTENSAQQQISKKCPHCQRTILKNGGCNHMTCQCGHEFCWYCRAEYGTTSCHSSYCEEKARRNNGDGYINWW